MQVILLESISKLGSVGQEVRVRSGFGRNYLIPQEKALRATNENRKLFEARRAEIEKANDQKKSAAQKVAEKVDGKFITLVRQAGEDGHLYGSVTSRDIATQASALAGTEINHKQVIINKPIKTVGVYVQPISLHADVAVSVNVIVARVEGEADLLKDAFLNPKSEDKYVEVDVVEVKEVSEDAQENQA
jgi:large subunit ribosomal protein L9